MASFTYGSHSLPNHYNYYMYTELDGKILLNGVVQPISGKHPKKIEIRDKVYSPVISTVTIDEAQIRFTTNAGVQFF